MADTPIFGHGRNTVSIVHSKDDAEIVFTRLVDVAPGAIIDLMNNPGVRRHLPLARGHFGAAECAELVAEKERMWEASGYGPWGILIDGTFAGWGGLQPEGDDADVGLVLHPDHWGSGRILYERIIRYAFGELGLDSVIALLPPSRKNVAGMRRLGFRHDGEVDLEGERFVRYRLGAPPRAPGDATLEPVENTVGRQVTAQLASLTAAELDVSGESMSIALKRAYEAPASADGCRILVERLWPRGVSKSAARIDLWSKDTAPSPELRRWFDHQPDRWAEFKRRYFKELRAQVEPVADLLARVRSGPVTFVFASRELQFNNAVALKEYVERQLTTRVHEG